MKTKTYQERLVAGLTALGWTEFTPISRKYRAFRKPNIRNVFVGKNGALRSGDSPSASPSIGDPSRQGTFYKKVLEAAEGRSLPGQLPLRSEQPYQTADSTPMMPATA